MEVPPLSAAVPSGLSAGLADSSQSGSSRKAFTAARQLNALGIADRQYSVVRDPASHRFVVVVIDSKTGDVLDQFPPEDILKMLDQLASFNSGRAGNTGETQE